MARKKRRVARAEDEEAARQKFLEALEAQRANARKQSAEKPAETKAAPSLPGFYYDESRKRYFRSCPASERRQREQLELKQQQEQAAEQKPQVKVKFRRGYGVKSHNWVDYLTQRQSDFSWSTRSRDRRELMPQLLSGFLSSQVVEPQGVCFAGRLTALALHPRASNLGALGASSGQLDILGLSRMPPEPGTASPSQRVLPIASFDIDGVITALQWRPVRELDLLVCSLGSGQRNRQHPSGCVSFMRVGDQSAGGGTVMSNSRGKSWQLVDPWTAKWNPTTNGSNFSVGCGGTSTAAYVDAVGQAGTIQRAPTGTITSHVHAQSFYSTGHVVLNGTKDGGLWGWDLRSPSRAYEWEAEVAAGQPGGSVLDIHVLEDCCKAVVQRSNGELRLLDLRNCKPVVEFVAGLPKRYLPNLRCAVDTRETVVVAGGDTQRPQAVNSYELQHGRCVASVEVKTARNSSVSEKRSTLVQQVQLKSGLYDTRYADTPEIWALSRNELYICSGRTNDPIE